MGHSGVGWAVPGGVAELAPSTGLWLPCMSILLDVASSRLLGGWGGFSPQPKPVLRIPDPCCSFCLHHVCKGRAPCLPQGRAQLGIPLAQVDKQAAHPWI